MSDGCTAITATARCGREVFHGSLCERHYLDTVERTRKARTQKRVTRGFCFLDIEQRLRRREEAVRARPEAPCDT